MGQDATHGSVPEVGNPTREEGVGSFAHCHVNWRIHEGGSCRPRAPACRREKKRLETEKREREREREKKRQEGGKRKIKEGGRQERLKREREKKRERKKK